MNPEKAAMKSLDSQKRLDKIKELAERLLPTHEKISHILKKISMKMEDFEDLYTSEIVEKDLKYVEQRKNDFAEIENNHYTNDLTIGEIKKLSEILEYHIIRGVNVGKWIPFCRAIKTSEFDDIANGMDAIIEFEKSNAVGHLGLGVDFSFSNNLSKKFERIKKEIDEYDGNRHRLGRVKYFSSKNTGMRGELSGLPRVVVALDLGALEDLSKAKEISLSGHAIKHSVVMEMERQLAVFADYANDNNPACLEPITRAQNFIHVVAEHLESENKLKESEYFKNEKAQEAIENGLSIFR